MRKLIITILLLLPLSAIAADKTFSAGESLTLTSNTTWDSAYSNATKTDWAVVTGTQTITSSDYNWFYNVTNPYDDVTVSSGQGNDVSGTDPDFVDPARCLTKWFGVRYNDETPTKAESVEKLLALNGYNSTNKTQSDDIDLIYWDLKTDVDTFLAARENIGELLGSSPSTPTIRSGGIVNGGLRP